MALKDKWSSITHFIGFVAAIIATPIIVIKAACDKDPYSSIIALIILMFSMILLYGASSFYHVFDISKKVNMFLKRLDHCSIFVLIAGSYTPVFIIGLHDYKTVLIVWIIAIIGILIKIFWINCPKFVSSIMYISMGWIAIFSIVKIFHTFTTLQFVLLLGGGILYTIGGVIYAFKPKIFKNESITGFGNHELFHIFVMLGTLLHYLLVFSML